MENPTLVFEGGALWSRSAYLKLEGDSVIFDCSDGEYGPIKFPIQFLVEALDEHKKQKKDGKTD